MKDMDLNSQPLVSVVTPVYNGEKYLAECIESVLAQTYGNWENIVVNNCSTDRTLEISEYYAKRDTRIRIHNNTKFLGLIQNHNNALRQISAKSKYCKMLHADDFLFPDCIRLMVKLAEANPSVGVVGSYCIDGNSVSKGLPFPTTIISGRDGCRSCLLGNEDFFGSPTESLIRSDLIRSRKKFYNEASRAADKEAMYDVLQNSEFGFVHQILTFYRHHGEKSTMEERRLGGTFLLGKIIILKKYGPIYLRTEEYERLLKGEWRDYYRALVKRFLALRTREVWDYNRKIVEESGLSFSFFAILEAIFLELTDILLNPKNTVEKAISRVFKRKKNAGSS